MVGAAMMMMMMMTKEEHQTCIHGHRAAPERAGASGPGR
jgi:hypothetical protein